MESTQTPAFRSGGRSWGSHEVLFALCMGIVAAVGRESPLLRFPDIQWAFGAFLVFNLALHRRLAAVPADRAAAFVSSLGNSALIAWILSASGREESRYWPMHLLPLLTAALSLRGARLSAALAAPAAFLAYFHLDALWTLPPWQSWELLAKLAVLAFAAGLCARSAASERGAAEALSALRAELDLATRVRGGATTELTQSVRRKVHDANNLLTVVLASCDLIQADVSEGSPPAGDARRIKQAGRECARLLDEISCAVKGHDAAHGARPRAEAAR